VDVRVLGPVEVRVGGRLLELGAPQTRAVLAVLVIRCGDVVSVDRLVDELWPSAPPADTRSLVHGHVSRLRRSLRASRLGEEAARRLVTRKPGYLLRVDDGELDVARFERLLIEARAAHRDGDPDRCIAAYREAHQQWRGEPYADVPHTPLVAAEANRLAGLRLSTLEERFDAELGAGLHADIVDDLTAITAHHPLRERLVAQLMLALHRIGNTTEALALYERTRHRLVDELGLDPGTVLREVHTAILRDDPSAAPPAGAAGLPGQILGASEPLPIPRQLPPDVAGFTGRGQELADLERALAGAAQHGPVVISAIQGSGGIGKSALAIHAAHRLGERFPDGQLYVDLHGSTVGLSPLEPLEVLGRFLRALGVDPAAVPTGLEEAAALYRSLVAGRRLLVVLDNAVDAAQVVPLLPGSHGCGVLLTSRRALGSLPGARHLQLDVLPVDEAMELLGHLAGAERVAREPAATAAVAHWCGYVPLALRIAGARLAARPAWPVATLAERLADAQRRLDELELADGGVRTSLAVSYQQLRASADAVDRTAATAFGLLGVLDGPDMGVPVVARLLDLSEEAAERVLERLADAHLLATPAPGRYRLHDLLRLYAREVASRHHPETERAAALTRALGFYVATSWQTLALLRPGDHRLTRADDRWSNDGLAFDDEQTALGWLEAERGNLLAAVGQAATTPGVPAEVAVQLAHALFGFFLVHNYLQDWEQINHTALEVAHRTGDRAAQAQVHNDLGIVHRCQGRYEQAAACQRESLRTWRELGDRRGQAASLGSLGNVYESQGRYQEALTCQQESLSIWRELGDRGGQAISLNNLGLVYQRLGRYQEALTCQQESLAIDRELDDRQGQAISLANLGNVYDLHGRHEEALACLQASLAISRALGNRMEQAFGLNSLGTVYQRQGRDEQALACLREGLRLYGELGMPHGQAESLRELGVTLRALGRSAEARAHWHEALAIFERLQTADADQVRAFLASLPGPASQGR
jgi:tetratricopeptide (TPR) repeat protein/DNA-binding SARP family transcriptional activator